MTTLTKTLGFGSAIAATAIGMTLTATSANAASLGAVAFSGGAEVVSDSELKFFDVKVTSVPSAPSGIFAGLGNSSVIVKNLTFSRPSGNYSAVESFLKFTNGIAFDLDAGQIESIGTRTLTDALFTGTFRTASGGVFGEGSFGTSTSGKGKNKSTSFNGAIDAEAVPEPMTILGSAAALGFGALFKKRSQKA